MLPLVLMVPLALVSLDFMVPRPLTTPMVLVPFGWAPSAASSRRLAGEASAEETLEGKLEKLLNTMNATVDDTGESWHEPTIHHDRSYTGDYPYDPNYPSGGGEDDAIKVLMGFMVVIIIGSTLLCLSGLIFACQYKSKVTDRRPPMQGGLGTLMNGDFRTGPFSCFDDTPTCCHATFCGACRAGDTYQAAGAQQFWTVIGLFMLCNIIGNVVAQLVTNDPAQAQNMSRGISALATGGIFHGYRRQLRTRLGGSDSAQSPFVDFLLWACCSCCVIAQEARELDAAMGVRVECCCNLQAVGAGSSEMGAVQGQPQVTGQPVGVYPAMPVQPGQPQFAGQPQVPQMVTGTPYPATQ